MDETDDCYEPLYRVRERGILYQSEGRRKITTITTIFTIIVVVMEDGTMGILIMVAITWL